MAEERKNGNWWLPALFIEGFGMSRVAGLAATAAVLLMIAAGVFWFFYSAPPRVVTIAAGPPGSSFETNAQKLAVELARDGVKLRILQTQGSLDNLERLEDLTQKRIDLGFVLSGTSNSEPRAKTNTVASLGSVMYQPLLVFYRGQTRELLSQFKGQRVVIGPPGSGTRALSMILLTLNGLGTNDVSIVELDPAASSRALTAGAVDALFLMGDSASPQVMGQLMRNTNIQLFDFAQADGYTRRITYLHKIVLPRGSMDFGRDIPSHDVTLIGPTVELVARRSLHPALIDVLLEGAHNVYGPANLIRRENEFPMAVSHGFDLSREATRYYKSGKFLTYQYLPFRLGSFVNRFVAVFLPLAVVMIPGMRLIPTLLRLRMRFVLFRWYRLLLALDRELVRPNDAASREEMNARLERIAESVNKIKVPASFADQFYVLRQHIEFVRSRLPK